MTDTLRVLYVDDETDLLEIGKLFLEETGDFSVVTIDSASAALTLLASEKFDAIISDYQMPGMNGIQFLIEVRKRLGQIPFILFTGRGREEVVIQAINSGVNFYLQKGGEQDALFAELSHKIKQAAYRKKAEDSLEIANENLEFLVTERTSELFSANLQLQKSIEQGKTIRESLKEYAKRASILNEVIFTANEAETLPQLFKDSLDKALELLDFESGGIYLVDIFTKSANVIHSKNLPLEFLAEIRSVPIDTPPFDTLFIKNQPIITEHYEELQPEMAQKFHFRSLASIPLVSKNKVIGALNVASLKRYTISEDEKQVLVIIGRELGTSIMRMIAEEEAINVSVNLQTLFDSIDEMVFVLDMQGYVLAVNKTVEKRLLYGEKELIGTNVLLLHVPERRDEALKIVQDMIAGTIDSCPVPVLTKEGTRIEVETKVTRGMWNNQEVLMGVSRDVTDRKKAEEALQHNLVNLSILNEIISAGNKADDLSELLTIILDESLRLLDFDVGGIYLIDISTKTANIIHSKNLPLEFLTEIRSVPIDRKPYDTLFIQNEPLITENYATVSPEYSKKYGFQSMVSIPLLSKGVVIGALNIASLRRYVISDEEKQILISISRELGSTIERMTAEEKVKEAAKNLETLFNSIDEMLFVLDMKGHILAVNDSVEKRLLYSPVELTGLDVLMLHVPERRDEALQNVEGMIAGTIDSCPVPLLAKDGTRIEVETKVTRGKWNNLEVIIGVSRDVTERKQAEEALVQLSERLSLATRAGGVGIWDLDLINNKFTWDDQMFSLYGISREQFGCAYDTWQAMVHPEDRKKSDDEVMMAIRGEKEFNHEFRILWPDKSIHTIRALALVQRDSQGLPLRMIGTSWDITEIKSQLENIRQINDCLLSFGPDTLENITALIALAGTLLHGDCALYTRIDKGVLCTSGAWQTTPDSDLCNHPLGQICFDIITNENNLTVNIPDVNNFQSAEIEAKLAPYGLISLIKKDIRIRGIFYGSLCVLYKTKHNRTESDKKLLSVITLAIGMEEERKKAREQLNDFAYIVSHDLKAPLRGIASLAHWLKEDYASQFDEKGVNNLNMIVTRVSRMQNLIEGILTYSKIERTPEVRVQFPVRILIEDVIDNLTIPDQFSINIPDNMPVIIGDKIRVTQIFENLISNAIKYTNRPDGVIDILLDSQNGFYTFGVRDNGPGIDKKYHERVFQIFQTLHKRDDIESTGVGLTIVRKLVEQMGGRIWIESEYGHGATFFFTIPV